MHFTTEFTGVSKKAVDGILEVATNVLLLCNSCIRSGRDKSFEQQSSAKG